MTTEVHSEIFEILTKMHEKQALPQALGFFGPAGIGKGEFAHRFAKNQLLSEGERSANLFLIEPNEKGVISKSQVESIQSAALTAGAQKGNTVILVRGADAMNTEAQNALLKLLEDPAPQVFFLLTAVHASKLLDTVKSRLSIYYLRQISWESQNDEPLAAMYAGRPHLKPLVEENEEMLTKLAGLSGTAPEARLRLLTGLARKDRKEITQLLELAARHYYAAGEKKALTGALEALGILRYNGNKSLALDSLLDL